MEESELVIKKHPELVRATLDLYGTISRATQAIINKPALVQALWAKAGVRMPRGGLLVFALDAMEVAGQTARSEDDLERARAKKYEVYAKQTEGEVVHVMINRITKEVVETAADKLTRWCEPFEPTKPGFTRFLGDLVTFYRFNDSTLKIRGEESGFVAAAPAPYYRWAKLAGWADLYGSQFYRPAQGQSQPMRIYAHVQILGAMETLQFIELQRTFYTVANSWTAGIVLKTNIPVRQLGLARVKGKPFFESVPKPKIAASQYLYRTGGWNFDIPPPQTTKEGLAYLSASRAWRGENQKGYSDLTRGHATGGDFSDLRIQVCTLLGLVRPLLESEEKDVYIETDALAAAAYVHLELVRLHEQAPFKVKWFWIVSREKGKIHFKGDMVTHTARDRAPGCMLVDMVSTQLPSFQSKTDVDATWELHFSDLLPDAPYICKRKVPPRLVSQYNCYSLGSMHAYDSIVASRGVLKVMEVTVKDDEEGNLKFLNRIRSVDRIESMEDYLALQHEDNRRKLCFYQWDCKVTYTGMINLWTLPEQYSKSDLRNLVTQINFDSGEDLPMEKFDASIPLLDFENPLPPPVLPVQAFVAPAVAAPAPTQIAAIRPMEEDVVPAGDIVGVPRRTRRRVIEED